MLIVTGVAALELVAECPYGTSKTSKETAAMKSLRAKVLRCISRPPTKTPINYRYCLAGSLSRLPPSFRFLVAPRSAYDQCSTASQCIATCRITSCEDVLRRCQENCAPPRPCQNSTVS